MPERLYFDCNASFGPYPNKPREARWSKQHLLDDLDLAGVAGALVYHRLAQHYSPMLANLRLVEEIGDDRERLYPCWMALPSLSPEVPAVGEFVRQMVQHDVRAVRLEPEPFGIPIKDWIWGELRDALLEREVLCVVPIRYGGSLEPVDALLSIFGEHNTLLQNHNWGQWRHVVALMEEHPNLHCEFSSFQANRAIEYFVERFGAERCLFGTNLPEKAPGAARGFLDFTLLPEEQASLVAGENLRRLLGGQGPTRVPEPGEWHDSITEAVRAGKPVPCFVADGHCHLAEDGGQSLGGSRVALRGDADGMIELTRRCGIDETALMSWVGPLCMDSDFGNETVAKAVERYPDELIGLATINPEYDDKEQIERIIRRYHVELGFPGLKTLTTCQTIHYDNPLFERWFQFANDNNLYLVLDAAGTPDEVVRNVAERYPNLSLHLDHCGKSWAYAKSVVALMTEYGNLWAQLNYTLVTNGVIEYLAEQVGADRMLFGTDAPMRDPRPQVGWLAFTRLPEADKRKIYGENFAGILRRAGVAV